jgi:hypothetical protein
MWGTICDLFELRPGEPWHNKDLLILCIPRHKGDHPVHLYGQAAILRGKLPDLDRWNASWGKGAQVNGSALADHPNTKTPCLAPDRKNVYHFFIRKVSAIDIIQVPLKKLGIDGSALHTTCTPYI